MAKIIGHGAPTSKTFGVLGQEYFDKDSNKVYTCTKVTHKTAYRAGEADAEYEWTVIGGGSDPFEVKREIITIVPEQSVTSEYSQDTPVGTVCMNRFPKTMDLIDGAKYIVCINNKNYEVTAKEVMGLVVIGDPFLYGAHVDSTGEPFFFMVMHEDPTQYVFVWKAEFGTTVTTSITCEQEIFEKIDYKFMPEGYPKVETKKLEIISNMSITKSETWSEWYRNYNACGNAFDGMDISHLPDLMDYKGTFVIIINGKEYECSYYYPPQFFPDDFKAMGCKENPECPFEVTFFDYGFDLVWDPALGETITFSAYIKEETVTPMDSRFSPIMGSIVVWVSSDKNGIIHKDVNRSESYSKEMLDSIMERGNIRIQYTDNADDDQYLPIRYYKGSKYNTLYWVKVDGAGAVTLCNAFTNEFRPT